MKKWAKVEDVAKEKNALNSGSRGIKVVVVHHSWRPNHKQWKGDRSADGIMTFWKLRQREEGWSAPPGGHFLVAPKGEIYMPFTLDKIINANSDRKANATGIGIETVGNFDTGNDILEGVQEHALHGLVGLLLVKFGLTTDNIFFHRDFPAAHKSCPGTSLDRTMFRNDCKSSVGWAKDVLK